MMPKETPGQVQKKGKRERKWKRRSEREQPKKKGGVAPRKKMSCDEIGK